MPEISAKGITHPAGQYLLEENKKSGQDMHAAVTYNVIQQSLLFIYSTLCYHSFIIT